MTPAREIAFALLLFGAIGLASLTIHQVAWKSSNVALLPTTVLARTRWWRAHLATALTLSTCLLLLGLLGLCLMP